jgi:hypothetical protein
VVATIGLPSVGAWLLSVSRTRKNFSASMGVTPAVAVSPFVEMEYWEFNHLYEIAALDFVDQD